MTLTSLIAKALSIHLSVDPEEVTANLTTPPRPEMGDIALPCFRYAKVMRKAPQAIADELKAALDKERETSLKALYERIERIDTAGGYLNFFKDRHRGIFVPQYRQTFPCRSRFFNLFRRSHREPV